MNPLKKLAGQTAIYGLPTILGRLLNYLLTPLYTYSLSSTADFGILTEMYAYTSFLLIILTYGMETSLFHFAKKNKNAPAVFNAAMSSIVCTSLLFIILCLVFTNPLANLLGGARYQAYIQWFALIIGADAITSLAMANLRLQNQAKRFAFINSLSILVNIGLNLFFILLLKPAFEHANHLLHPLAVRIYDPQIGVIGYAFIANLVASLLKLPLLWSVFKNWTPTWDWTLLKQLLRYAWPLLLAGLAGMMNETLDRILLKYLLPPNVAMQQLGIYGACYKIAIIMTIFIQTFRYAAEPFFFAHSDAKDGKQLYAQVMNYFVIVCCLLFLGTLLNLSWIQAFVAPAFRAGLKVVPVLLLANVCLGVFFNLSIWYKLSGKTGYGAVLTGIGACITLALNFLLIPRMGYMGAAWATLICYATMMALSYYWGNKHYPVNYPVAKLLFYLALSLLLYALSQWLPVSASFWKGLWMNNALLGVFLLILVLVEKPQQWKQLKS